MFLKIKAFFMALVIALGSISLLFRPAVPEAKSIEELKNTGTILNYIEPADKIYVLEYGQLKNGDFQTAICLQGLANKEKAQLIILNGTHQRYFEEVCKSGAEISRTDSNGNKWNLATLIEEFKSCIKDSGYVLYRNTEYAEGLNTACNYSTVEGWLAIPKELESLAQNCGLVLKKDISNEEYNYEFLNNFFKEYKDCFNKKAIIHCRSYMFGLRDLAIQQGFYITYSDETSQGIKYLEKILKWTGGNSYILGWAESEKHFVKRISKYGCAVVPADYCLDNSFFNAYKTDIPEQTGKGSTITADPDKHYAAIVFSDGDNMQWVQNGFSEYYQKLRNYDTFPMSWTFPLISQEMNSSCTKLTFESATDKNYFVAGCSGAGYMNPSSFKAKYLDRFTTETASLMLKSNIDVVTILDSKYSLIETKAFEQNFDYYSRFDNIKGGLVMLDPDRYSYGKGKVWFSNDKPFISVRLSLWYPDTLGDTVTDEWIEEQAEIVNSYAKDPTSIDGYSYININPWTVSVEKMTYFVSLLDDSVELVKADELIDLVTKNVKHINATPGE